MKALTQKHLDRLGLTDTAGMEDIKSAFKRLAFQYHPDRNPHNVWAEEKFREVLESYSYLSGNQEALKALHGAPRDGSVAAEATQDIFKILFEMDAKPLGLVTAHLHHRLFLNLEEAFLGGDKKIQIERYDLCPECLGAAIAPGAKTFTCTYCFGEGYLETESARGPHECPKCNGRGFLSSSGCVACRARGRILKKIKLKITIPVRAQQRQRWVVSGEGHEYEFGKRGDLHLEIQLNPHARFTFDGKDIMCEITVELGDAALGGEVRVPTLAGFRKLSLPPGTQSGQVHVLKGYGLGGDQLIRVWVKTPKAFHERERRILRGWSSAEGKKSPQWWVRLKQWLW